MQITEPQWMRTLRSEVKRTSLRRVERVLGYSDTTITQVLNGKYPRSVNKFAACVQEKLKPQRKRRAKRPAQLKQLDPAMHAKLKHWAEVLAQEAVAAVIGIDEARVWPLIRGTDKLGAADVLTKLNTRLAEVPL